MELSDTAISLPYPPHPRSCTERHHPPYLVFLLLACQSLFLFSIHQYNFFSPLTIHAIHHPQGLTTSTSSLVLFICVSAREREFSWGAGTEQEQGTRNAAFNIGYTLPKLSYRHR